MTRRAFALVALVVVVLLGAAVGACGTTGQSGWNADEEHAFLTTPELRPTRIAAPNPSPRCALRVAERRFRTYADYTEATTGGYDSAAWRRYAAQVNKEC
jgi:hypothetical protein